MRSVAVLLSSAFAIGCGSTSPNSTGNLNVLLNNQTGRNIGVALTVGGTVLPTINLAIGAFISDEFPGGSAGSAITITVGTTDGTPVLNTNRQCTPTAAIIGTSVYGQVDLVSNLAGIGILCTDPASWQ